MPNNKTNQKTIHVIIISTKPDIIKMAPLYKQFMAKNEDCLLIHTGQHFDKNLSGDLLLEFNMRVDYNISATGDNCKRTAQIIINAHNKIKELLAQGVRPIFYLHGDTLGAFAVGIAAMYNKVECIHIESGVRTATFKKDIYKELASKLNDQKKISETITWWLSLHHNLANFSYESLEPFPEQFNARYLDMICKLRFCSTRFEKNNILRESLSEDGVFIVGNTISDSINNAKITHDQNEHKDSIRFCIHRTENCNSKKRFLIIFSTLEKLVTQGFKIVLIKYPAMKIAIHNFGLMQRLETIEKYHNLISSDVISSYKESLMKMTNARLIITDSGTLQEEANILKIPCLTIRYGTDRLFSVANGWNIIAPPINSNFLLALIISSLKSEKTSIKNEIHKTNVSTNITGIITRLLKKHSLGLSEEERLYFPLNTPHPHRHHLILDIDDCLIPSSKNTSETNEILLKLGNINTLNIELSLCTGRSAPYLSMLSKIISINQWCICENGSYLYNPQTNKIILHPLITDQTRAELHQLKTTFNKHPYQKIFTIEPGKEICISLNPILTTTKELFIKISEVIDHSIFYINYSNTAVDITPKGVDKGSGLKLLAEQEQFNLADVLAIGDSSGDLPFMTLAGKKACPANANDAVKAISDYISPYPTTEGVIDIINYFNTCS